ncbi:MAG: RdgB/HAM1 family non-canonical purine NTP pyrophosphatase [Defluviitaleaceae bacterium]|nr:RdgB/HAM1 family non-canonical purine NTP pyrophosphatase [Defluviitaleaceae bacterium]
MQRLIIATKNECKINEIKRFFEEVAINGERPLFNILSLGDVGVDLDLEAVEDGATFEENATKKAIAVWKALDDENCIVLADDSGLEIDALGGEPGVDSANFMGRETPYQLRFDKILDDMRNVPYDKRNARFVCVMAVVIKSEVSTFKATIEGKIVDKPTGCSGFGYDPIFCVPEFNCTSAELSLTQKNKISHRGKALQMVVEHLK